MSIKNSVQCYQTDFSSDFFRLGTRLACSMLRVSHLVDMLYERQWTTEVTWWLHDSYKTNKESIAGVNYTLLCMVGRAARWCVHSVWRCPVPPQRWQSNWVTTQASLLYCFNAWLIYLIALLCHIAGSNCTSAYPTQWPAVAICALFFSPEGAAGGAAGWKRLCRTGASVWPAGGKRAFLETGSNTDHPRYTAGGIRAAHCGQEWEGLEWHRYSRLYTFLCHCCCTCYGALFSWSLVAV